MKPYKFVPISRTVKREQLRHRDKLQKHLNHGKWMIRAKTVTPIMVLSGYLTYDQNNLAKGIILNNDGVPIIPGSSLKGTIRSTFEALTQSCITPPQFRLKEKLPENNQEKCTSKYVCPSCQVFGYVGKSVGRSLISFSDLVATTPKEQAVRTENVPSLYQPMRSDKAIWKYLDQDEIFQRKFYTHGIPQNHEGATHQVVRENVEFRGEISYENLTDEELAILLNAFGSGEIPFTHKIGYAKPAYFGSIQFSIEEIIPYQSPFFQAKNITVQSLKETSKNMQDPFFKQQKEKIAIILNYDKNRNNTWKKDSYGRKGC